MKKIAIIILALSPIFGYAKKSMIKENDSLMFEVFGYGNFMSKKFKSVTNIYYSRKISDKLSIYGSGWINSQLFQVLGGVAISKNQFMSYGAGIGLALDGGLSWRFAPWISYDDGHLSAYFRAETGPVGRSTVILDAKMQFRKTANVKFMAGVFTRPLYGFGPKIEMIYPKTGFYLWLAPTQYDRASEKGKQLATLIGAGWRL